jgi:PTH1 family peptidyl-tRNA hydrolase
MRLIVGLGNPGARYKDTPHNAGFQICDRFAARHQLGREVEKYQGLFLRGNAAGEDVGVLKPQTYMNLSGQSVGRALRYLPAEPEDLIVVFDDIDTPAGRLRIRKLGGHGGHNGLRSIFEHVHTQEFPRIRVGVGRPRTAGDATGHVLGKLRGVRKEEFSATVTLAVDALDEILERGIDAAMNRFNVLSAARDEGEK